MEIPKRLFFQTKNKVFVGKPLNILPKPVNYPPQVNPNDYLVSTNTLFPPGSKNFLDEPSQFVPIFPERPVVSFDPDLLNPTPAIKKGSTKKPIAEILSRKQDNDKPFIILDINYNEKADLDFVISIGEEIYRKNLRLRNAGLSCVKLFKSKINPIINKKRKEGKKDALKFHLVSKGNGIEDSIFTKGKLN